MTDEEYRLQMDRLLLLGGSFAELVDATPLAQMAETVERADAVGAILDPTKYREALADGRLRKQRAAIAAARAFAAAWRLADLPRPGPTT